jgi:hypothetical protein
VSGVDGSYSLDIANGQFPCIVKAKSSDGLIELHAAVETSALTFATANVTPLTELVVTRLNPVLPSELFNNFELIKPKIDNIALAIATNRVRSALASVLNIETLDPHKSALIAASATVTGNTHDKLLDSLRDRLSANNVKLPQLVGALSTNHDSAAPQAIVTLLRNAPTTTPLAPVTPTPTTVATCPALKSGVYQVIEPDAPTPAYLVTVDATTKRITSPIGTESFVGNGCLFTGQISGAKLALGPEGLGVLRTAVGTLAAVFPKQDIAISELEGTWSWVGRAAATGTNPTYPLRSEWGTKTFNSTGTELNITTCNNSGCAVGFATLPLPTLIKTNSGSFTHTSGDSYVFKTPSGAIAMIKLTYVGTNNRRGLQIYVKGVSPDTPNTGAIQNSYLIGTNASNVVDTNFRVASYAVTSSDLRLKSYSRLQSNSCGSETLSIDQPHLNLLTQVASQTTPCSTTAFASEETTIVAAIKGLGVSVGVSTNTAKMIFHVER